MVEKWFCFYDIHFYEEDTYVPRHNKGAILTESMSDAMNWITSYFGENIDSIHLRWAGKKGEEPKQELNFTESEFDRFEMLKMFIEDDKAYEDYSRINEEYEKSRKNK